MQLWPIAHFFHFVITFWWVQQQTHPKVMTEWKKLATGQICIRTGITSYKIHSLGPTHVILLKIELIMTSHGRNSITQ